MTFAPLLVGAATFDCASSGSDDNGSPSDTSSGEKEPRPNGIMNILGSSDASGGKGANIDPLCGAGTCVPDGEASCDGEGGASMGGSSSLGGAAYGGSFGGAPSFGSSCKLEVTPFCKEDCVKRSCVETGGLGRGEACSKASDCAEGLGCVSESEGQPGTCQAYCCLGSENTCGTGYFCDLKPAVGDQVVKLPVCAPIVGCSLLDPFPCPTDVACQCAKDRACLMVRGDGRTSCAFPGVGVQGDSCTSVDSRECAAGFVCSTSLGCLKICDTKKKDADCAAGTTCQSADFSTELGVCVPSSSGTEVTR